MKKIMKKTLFIVLMLALAHNTHAQLVVDSLGRVGVGTETPLADLQIGNDGLSEAKVSIHGENKYGLSVFNRPPSSIDGSTAIKVTEFSRSKNGTGINVMTLGYSSDSTSVMTGVLGRTGGQGISVGVMGGRASSYIKDFAGIYGTTSLSTIPSFRYPGIYAGYFNGPVLATGRIYGTVYSLSSVPKVSANTRLQTIGLDSGGEESITDKLLSVQTVQFMREEELETGISMSKETGPMKYIETSDLEALDTENIGVTAKSDVETEMVKHYGLDGEQLKTTFPELVVEDSQGNYHINYSEMVPLLLQSIRELKAELEELKSDKDIIATKKAKATSIESEIESTDIVRMSQNTPNPFSESSVITLNIPKDTKNAAIYIYDLSGKQVKNIIIDKRGETDITVYASDLTEGMFVYSLVVDGTVAATRRMMVVRN